MSDAGTKLVPLSVVGDHGEWWVRIENADRPAIRPAAALSPRDKAMSYMGGVTGNTRIKAGMVWDACLAALGRAPGVIWGKDSNPDNTEHYSGRALDFMTGHHGWGDDRAVGDWITRHVLDNAEQYGLSWVIWRQHIYYAGGGGYDMADRGSTTANHYDHPHVYFKRDSIIGTITPGATATGIQEEEDMPITNADIDKIARRTAQIMVEDHLITRPDGHSATLGQHIADIAQTAVALRDGDLPVIERPDGSHKAELGLVLGNIEQRVVEIDDQLKK